MCSADVVAFPKILLLLFIEARITITRPEEQ